MMDDDNRWTCANCGEPSGMYGHATAKGFTCEPKPRTEVPPEQHRCSGCDHRWDGPLKGAELCGDCWRKAQPVVHGTSTPPAPHCYVVSVVEKVQRLAHWEVEDDLPALRTRLACIGAAAVDYLAAPPAQEDTVLAKRIAARLNAAAIARRLSAATELDQPRAVSIILEELRRAAPAVRETAIDAAPAGEEPRS